MDWYYAENGEQRGPIPEEQWRDMVNAGTIRPDTLVWNEGMEGWQPYADVAGPAQAAVPPAVPATPGNASAPATAATGHCRECGREVPLDNMVTFEGATICAECQPQFFQRLHEGTGGTGDTPNSELTALARQRLSGRWGLAIGVCLAIVGISIAAGCLPVLGIGISAVVSGPISIGCAIFFLALIRQREPTFDMLFRGFRQFGTALLAYILVGVFVFLWSLLFIIPGILAAFSYSMTFFVIADDPEISAMDALRRSKAIMYGNRWKYFCLSLRFLGWSFLCMFTFFLGYIWLAPYMAASFAAFYDDVKGQAAAA